MATPSGVCRRCENSPLCDRRGHPRGEHGQVFVRGVRPGCRRPLGDFQSLTTWTCDCPGFRPVVGPLRDATFAQQTEEETEIPRLRLAEPP